MASQILPKADSPEVQLVVGTPEEMRRQWLSNSAEWSGPFSVETYVHREETLLDQDFTREGGLTPWLLVQQQPDGPRKILCGCETFNKKALVAMDGSVKDVVCHGLGSVFCPIEHRGKGYAGRMMIEVAKRLKDWQAQHQEVLFSVLFSDIGKDFYAAVGWQVFPSAHISIEPSLSNRSDLPKVKFLTSDDIPELCREDEGLLRVRLHSMPKTARTTVAVVPDARTIIWHHARASFFAKELFNREIVNRGAIVEIGPGKRAWCYWQHNWSSVEKDKDNKLYLLHLVIEGEDGADFALASESDVSRIKDSAAARAVAALLSAAQAEAARWSLSSVDAWNPTSVTFAAAQLINADVSILHRESSSITSLQWYGPGSWQDVDWIYNERYAWC